MIDQEQKIRLVERALYEGWRSTATSEVIATDAWLQVITPSAKTVFMNGVFRSLLEESEVDARIASMIALYQSRELPFWWIVSPSSTPKDMGERLLRAGFRLMTTAVGMFMEPAQINVRPAENVTVEEVGERNVEDWLAVQAEVWLTSPDAILAARESIKKQLASKDGRRIQFIARIDGRPAGASSVRFFDGFALLLGAAVVPEYRRRGICRTMICHRANVLMGRGVSYATSHAIKDMGAPILQKLGVESVCEIHYYAYP